MRCRLQPRRHLGHVERRDARIGDAGGEQHRGIGGAVLHRLITVDPLERPIAGGIGDGAPFGLFAVAVLLDHVAQRVRPADPVDHRGEQIRPLGHGASDRDAARRTSADGEMLRRGVFLGDEFFAHGDQIAPGVRLVGELSGLVPFAAVFAAAAHIGVTDDGAGVDQRQGASGEGRRVGRRAVGAVGGNPGRRAAIVLQAFAVNQGVRNFDAVLGGGEEALGLVGADVDGGFRRDAGVGELPAASTDQMPVGVSQPDSDSRAPSSLRSVKTAPMVPSKGSAISTTLPSCPSAASG